MFITYRLYLRVGPQPHIYFAHASITPSSRVNHLPAEDKARLHTRSPIWSAERGRDIEDLDVDPIGDLSLDLDF